MQSYTIRTKMSWVVGVQLLLNRWQVPTQAQVGAVARALNELRVVGRREAIWLHCNRGSITLSGVSKSAKDLKWELGILRWWLIYECECWVLMFHCWLYLPLTFGTFTIQSVALFANAYTNKRIYNTLFLLYPTNTIHQFFLVLHMPIKLWMLSGFVSLMFTLW